MIEHLPAELAHALARADRTQRMRVTRLLLHVNDRSYRILRMWPGGFAIAAEGLGPLRGQVEITDGARASWSCLIVASRLEGAELHCDFKRMTAARSLPPADYARPEAGTAGPEIAGYLPPA